MHLKWNILPGDIYLAVFSESWWSRWTQSWSVWTFHYPFTISLLSQSCLEKKFYKPSSGLSSSVYGSLVIGKLVIFTFQYLHVGKKTVMLGISKGEKNMGSLKSAKPNLSSSVLEFKLDELRKELSSSLGGIFPHSVLSTQQISMISAQKPNSKKQASLIITNPVCFKYQPRVCFKNVLN